MPASITERVRDSFEEGAIDDAKEYLERLLTAWKDTANSLAKTVTLSLLLMAVFELFAYEASKQIQIGSFSFANTSIVQIALPTLVAFMIYWGYRQTALYLMFQEVYLAVTARFESGIHRSNLDLMIVPRLPVMWGIGTTASAENKLTSEKLLWPVNVLITMLAMFVIPIAFQIQAFYHLFAKYGSGNTFLWINAILSGVLVIFSFIFYAVNSVDRFHSYREAIASTGTDT